MTNKEKNDNSDIKHTKKIIDEYIPNNTEKHIINIDTIRDSEDKNTFKSIVKYLWSFIVLGINWSVYKKLFIILLITVVLVEALVNSLPIGIILCLLTPVFLIFNGRYLYYNIKVKKYNDENKKFLLPSSLFIVWIMIIFLIMLLII